MKRILMICFSLLIILGSFSCNAQNNKKQNTAKTASSKVEVYYFHFTRRCMTCNAVETESKKSLQNLYPEQVKKGAITFKSINLDDKSSESLANKCQASGQSLLIIKGNKRTDLTSQGFMYARNNPDKLKQEIKKVVDPLLK
nr:nitrophenyl compound nitroreductase subunit ArsF family protein [uncultured Bacteroides sp.]